MFDHFCFFEKCTAMAFVLLSLIVPNTVIANDKMRNASMPQTKIGAYQFSFTSIDGEPMPLAQFKGKVMLIVNTASQCGFTKQYAGLEKLYDTYQDRGLVVIGVPCNNFGNQEPGSNEDIKEFIKNQYGVTFPMTEKYDVSGDKVHPFFDWAIEQDKGGFLFSKPRWNFHKYLIDRHGQVVKSFGSTVEPSSEKIISEIEKIL